MMSQTDYGYKVQRIRFRNMWYNKAVIRFTIVTQHDSTYLNINRDKLTLPQSVFLKCHSEAEG